MRTALRSSWTFLAPQPPSSFATHHFDMIVTRGHQLVCSNGTNVLLMLDLCASRHGALASWDTVLLGGGGGGGGGGVEA